MSASVQKSHTKILLLFCYRSHDGAADSPFGRSSPERRNASSESADGLFVVTG